MRTFKLLTVLFLSSFACSTSAYSNDTCGCYMLGTLCSIEGDSMCNKETLQCKCHKNVIGKNCDSCVEGYYDIVSGHGCSNCHCNPLGSIGKSCNRSSGQCVCKEGFTGMRCDQCAPFSYKVSRKKCVSCGCNSFGSRDLQCDVTGQCPCLKNVEGKHCDKCKENTYNIQVGCVPCPPCYDFVQDEVQNFTKHLDTLKDVMEGIENDLPLLVQNYEQFLDDIKMLKSNIQKLKDDCHKINKSDTSHLSLIEIKKKILDFEEEISKLMEAIRNVDVIEIENALEDGEMKLQEANNLTVTCEEALKGATEIAKKLDRHNETLSNMAKHVVIIRKDIERKSEKFEEVAMETEHICNKACSLSDKFEQDQKNLEKELADLGLEVANSTKAAEIFKNYVINYKQDLEAAKEKSEMLSKTINNMDLPEIEDQVKNIEQIKDDHIKINGLVQDLNSTSEQIQQTLNSASLDLDKLKITQEQTDNLYSSANNIKQRADIAVEDSDNAFKLAEDFLIKIQGYEAIKQEALDAINDIPLIRDTINEINDNSKAIENLFTEISSTLKDLEEIQNKVSKLSILAVENENELERLFLELEALEKEREVLSQKLQDSDANLKQISSTLEQQKKFLSRVEHEIARLKEFILYLDTIPTNKNELDAIDKEIDEQEQFYDTLEFYYKERDELKRQIEIVREIVESLPDDPTLCESAKSEPKTISF